MTTTHADVLDPTEHRLWREVRDARSRHYGGRSGAIREVAGRHGLDPEDLNASIADMKRRLVDAGAVPAERFTVVAVSGGRFVAASAPDKSSRWEALAARDRHLEFESLRYANNAAFAMHAHAAAADAGDRGLLVDILDAVATADGVVELSGASITVSAVGTDRGCVLGVRSVEDSALHTWAGTTAHATWIARAVATGIIDHLGGRATLPDQ